MSSIRSLFSTRRPIDRRIEKVIDYTALADDRLLAEIEEYEATDNVEGCFRKFLENYQAGIASGQVTEIGVWLSGFYGSGKSSFTKYLGLALDQKVVGGRPFIDLLTERFHATDVQAMLRTVAGRTPTAVIFLDLGAEQLAESALTTVSTVLYWKVLQQLGYSRDKKLAQLERTLERKRKLDEFRKLYREHWNEEWDTIHNDPLLGNARAAQVVPAVLPDDFPTPESFSRLKFEEAATVRDRAQEMIDLIRTRTGRPNVLFLIDEAGQYVAPRGELILNLDGLVRDFKEAGQGKVWIIATGQQTLAEIVTKAQYNSAELNKLQARFPIAIELDARDIKEITYRRLLTKTPQGEARLKAMFGASGQALITHTRLTGTSLYKTDPDADTFAQFYPFLPQHFDLLMDLIRSLARSTGGIGLRSAIKVIQDVLVDVNRLLPPGAVKLADRPVGALACAEDFYDILRADILKVLPHVVAAVDRTVKILGHGGAQPTPPLPVRVAKAVAALQNIEGFPCTAENISALLYPAVDSPGLLADVREALQALLAEKEIGLIEDPKVGGYVFLSDKVRPLQEKRSDMMVTSGDTTRIRNEILGRKIFEPQPSARLENTKEVKAAIRSGRLLVAGDSEDIAFRLEWVDNGRWEVRRTELLTETAAQLEWRNAIAWLVRTNDAVEELLPEIYKSEQIAQQIDERNADRDEAQFLRAELKQAERNREEVEKLFRQALLNGTLIFRGRPTPVAELGQTVEAATRTVLGQVAREVFEYYHLAPVRASTDLAARFLSVERLDQMPPDHDPLRLVVRKAGATRVDAARPPLAETLRAFRAKVEEVGGGRWQGNAIQDFFSGPPYGWSKDTVRYLFAALLVAGEVEFHTAEGRLKVAGPTAAEACKSTVAFNKVGVALRDAPPDLEALDRAARRLEELFGDNVLPLEDNIGRAVRRHVPAVVEMVGSLPDRLRLLMLPGEARVRGLIGSLTSTLSGDATDAGAIFGARDSALPEDIRWARAVVKAFDEHAEEDVRAASRLRNALTEMDVLFPGEGKYLLLEAEQQTLAEALGSERFFERLADIRAILRATDERVQTRYGDLWREMEKEVRAVAARLEAYSGWPLLLDEDRDTIMRRLQAALPPPAPGTDPLGSLKTLLVRRSGLAGLQRELEVEIERRRPPVPTPTQEPESLLDEAGQRLLEQQVELVQAIKLKYLGIMAGAMAHGLNQPIGIIRVIADGSLSDLRSGLLTLEETGSEFEKILAQTDRLARIVDNMRAFARGDVQHREPVDLGQVVAQMCGMFEDQFKNRHIALQCSVPQTGPALMAWANPIQVQEVLINLLTNARDAVEGQPGASVHVQGWRVDDEYCAFAVEDNGPGLSPEYRDQIFVPFVTTKPSEQGTGLGLFTSRRMVSELGGDLFYEDRPGGGARFVVQLPSLKETGS